MIERLGAVSTVLLDKTGALTLDSTEVEQVVSFDGVKPDEGIEGIARQGVVSGM